MPPAKFKVGDKVRFSRRCPLFVSQEHQGRTRTIVGVGYDSKRKCTFYTLGRRGKGDLGYLFRSYSLIRAERLNKRGKPPWQP